jgi:hypothetical protein
MSEQRERIGASLATLEAWGREHSWTGSDQYDALNASRAPRLLLRRAIVRRLLIQAVKRSPLDLRPALGIPPGQNAVSLAWAISAYVAAGEFFGEARTRERVQDAVAALERLRSSAHPEPCWGYHFDFQSRVFFYPSSVPNTIATSFAGFALLDAHRLTGDRRLLELAHGAGEFFLRRVPLTADPPGAFFGYLPGDSAPIHNSNLLACALLARLHELTGDRRMADAARQGVRWSLSRQRPDGSWPYGERSNLSWVDGFHTGYVLEALLRCHRTGLDDLQAPLRRGLGFYRERLLLPDGTPRYYAHETYPLDAWSAAQAIQTFALAAELDSSLLDAALASFDFCWRRMRRSDGLYLFQRRRLWRNPALHVRGVVAPMMLALAHLLRALDTAERQGRERPDAHSPYPLISSKIA